MCILGVPGSGWELKTSLGTIMSILRVPGSGWELGISLRTASEIYSFNNMEICNYSIQSSHFIGNFHSGQLYLEHFDRSYTFDVTHIHSLHHKHVVRFNSKNLRYTRYVRDGLFAADMNLCKSANKVVDRYSEEKKVNFMKSIHQASRFSLGNNVWWVQPQEYIASSGIPWALHTICIAICNYWKDGFSVGPYKEYNFHKWCKIVT